MKTIRSFSTFCTCSYYV